MGFGFRVRRLGFRSLLCVVFASPMCINGVCWHSGLSHRAQYPPTGDQPFTLNRFGVSFKDFFKGFRKV